MLHSTYINYCLLHYLLKEWAALEESWAVLHFCKIRTVRKFGSVGAFRQLGEHRAVDLGTASSPTLKENNFLFVMSEMLLQFLRNVLVKIIVL